MKYLKNINESFLEENESIDDILTELNDIVKPSVKKPLYNESPPEQKHYSGSDELRRVWDEATNKPGALIKDQYEHQYIIYDFPKGITLDGVIDFYSTLKSISKRINEWALNNDYAFDIMLSGISRSGVILVFSRKIT